LVELSLHSRVVLLLCPRQLSVDCSAWAEGVIVTKLYIVSYFARISALPHSGGGGKVASFKSETFPGIQFDLLHLSECVAGVGQSKAVRGGEALAFTGNSGASTGAHLDLRIKDLATGKRLRVRAGWLHWFLTGVKP
jgi:hypothetical protein